MLQSEELSKKNVEADDSECSPFTLESSSLENLSEIINYFFSSEGVKKLPPDGSFVKNFAVVNVLT
jgi:hypothetical protein